MLFGICYDLTHSSSITSVILLGNMYIYKQKMNGNYISVNYFLIEIKVKLDIEKTTCESNKTITLFNKKWANILETL